MENLKNEKLKEEFGIRLERELKKYCLKNDIGWNIIVSGGIILNFAKKFYKKELNLAIKQTREEMVREIEEMKQKYTPIKEGKSRQKYEYKSKIYGYNKAIEDIITKLKSND